MKKHHIERLRTLYAVMVGVPEGKLDLSDWRDGNFRRDDNDECAINAVEAARPDCGTTACAVGWACSFPEFVEQGLTFKKGPLFAYDTTNAPLCGWSAVQAFFGLDDETGEDRVLFLPRPSRWAHPLARRICKNERGLSDKRRVLQRIRRLLVMKGVITEERSQELAAQEATL